ncbi:hypothetical protein AQUCO_06100078v1 [Aquilegia coerulea]|uniref:DUF3730 domain-containing protein n=2 Tax=Aquilegia coerulea TaxID=218851 RepID=A0A2G5CDF2_AQUCA|nr:hypothetical protein AQUCO_06100078v1 [Aquilegia coerulea]
MKNEVQLCGVELVETLLSFYSDLDKHFNGKESIVELSKRLLHVQKQLGLHYFPELSSVLTSLFIILSQAEFEHEQLSIMKLSFFLLKWESENEHVVGRTAFGLTQELLFLLPVINFLSSPSGSIKAAATDLLTVLEKVLIEFLFARNGLPVIQDELPSISNFKSIICRLLQHLWFQEHSSFSSSYFLSLASNSKTESTEENSDLKSWISHLRNYCLLNVERQKSSLVSQRQKNISIELSLLLGSVVAGMVMHQSLGSYAVDAFAAIGIMDPKLGLPQLLSVLFYCKFFCNYNSSTHEMLLKLLELLPSVASHSAMIPLIVQTILPMLNKDSKPAMRATATRLLCKTWEVTDRIFGTLQGILHPKAFSDFISEKDVCISFAASIRDVCRKNPDRGVDLILSVSECIGSTDPAVKSLGFQSLGYLCEADVVDFYTAWTVIGKHVMDYSIDPTVAHGVCAFIRWGAMDAEAYSEASKTVLEILWNIGTSKKSGNGSKWLKARCSAFESLTQYEVEHIQRCIPDFKTANMQFLVSEDNPDVLRAMEGFEVKITTFEHNTRRRLLKERRIIVNKVEKLLDAFPQVVFHSGNSSSNPRDLPGAALICFSFTPKEVHNQGTPKELQKLHAAYETALVDIADSLQLSRNVLIAMLSLQSWKPFMQRWVKAVDMSLNAKVKSSASDKTSKAAADILKIVKKIAEESIPRSAENIALAVGALCMVLPPSAHSVTTTASKFLLEWLFQFEHEHRQWSAAITLGLVSTCLHTTDHKQKFDIITGLLKVACTSKSTLVKGACGVGLGFACQNHLDTSVEAVDNSASHETSSLKEVNLAVRIVRSLSMIICQLSPSSCGSLQRLCKYFPLNTDNLVTDQASEVSCDSVSIMEEDVWGIAGLILGLGKSVSAIYRAGGPDAVIMLKTLLTSWIPYLNYVDQNSSVCNVKPEMMLSVGSCLALPVVMEFCLTVELVTEDELIHMVNGFRELISELLSVKKSGSLHQSLLMVSCIGAGDLLSCILDQGVHSIKTEDVEVLLELFRKSYTNQYPPTIHFGGMLGVVNALGAGAGFLTHSNPKSSSLKTVQGQKDSSYIRGPILSAPVCEELSASLMQDMFLGAQDSKDRRLQKYAAWAVSFLRHRWWSKEPHIVDKSFNEQIDTKPISQTFSEDSVVWKLSLWLEELNYIQGSIIHVNTVATVLRCLSQAPRLPSLDWGAIIRRCMRYEDQVLNKIPLDHLFRKGALREECVMFALAHSNSVNQLLHFLDELSDISRFRTLELNLQTSLLYHLARFIKIFSASRLEKLFDDMTDYFSSSSSSYQVHNPDIKSLLRVSFWKGLYSCLEEASTESLEYVTNIKKCMYLLFTTLPALHIDSRSRTGHANSAKEWSEAIECIGKAPRNWLKDLLEIPEKGIVQGGSQFHEVMKKIQARVRLVMIGSIPLTELGKLRTNILHIKSDDIWEVLVDVVSVLQQAEGSVKRQWLMDAVEICFITNYPSTALKFIGLLAGSCCRYMPLLVLDQVTVLSDLPVTLPSLFSDNNWMVIAEPIVMNLWKSTERIFNWAKLLESASYSASNQYSIDESESNDAVFLTRVMQQTCMNLKDYLPFEKQLKLASMLVL